MLRAAERMVNSAQHQQVQTPLAVMAATAQSSLSIS
jgi:hypothetical protein